jgi:hypothetical protein
MGINDGEVGHDGIYTFRTTICWYLNGGIGAEANLPRWHVKGAEKGRMNKTLLSSGQREEEEEQILEEEDSQCLCVM